MLTDFFATDDIETTARRTGFVQRTSKITGKLFLALVTLGSWSDAKTTLAQLAAKVPHVVESLTVSPEALYQRMTPKAHAFLQAMIQQALARSQASAPVCEGGLFTAFTQVHIADSTGFVLPDSLQDAFPGSGGSAGKAGAKIQAVWDDKRSIFAHFMLTPLNLPDQKYLDTVVALALPGALFIVDLGYFKLQALARIAAAGAYFLSRLNHQASLSAATAEGVHPVELARVLRTVPGPLLEQPIDLGAKEQVAARLIAARVPEAIVQVRRRRAKENAKKKGYTPSKAYLALLAWNLFISNVPQTIWQPATVLKAYPIRWQIALIFKSWKSYLHVAVIKTKKAHSTLCYLYGRMLFIVLKYALCPQIRQTLWVQKKRELSVLNLVRPFQALAEWWLEAIFQSPLDLHRFLTQACAAAERLVVKTLRQRRTTAQTLRESLRTQHEVSPLMEAVNA